MAAFAKFYFVRFVLIILKKNRIKKILRRQYRPKSRKEFYDSGLQFAGACRNGGNGGVFVLIIDVTISISIYTNNA